jgi:hypothetical protein
MPDKERLAFMLSNTELPKSYLSKLWPSDIEIFNKSEWAQEDKVSMVGAEILLIPESQR